MSEKTFAGRTAPVTGGSRGIGRAISEMLAREALEKIESSARDETLIVAADVSSQSDVRDMIDTVSDRLGPIDLLVNDAGIVNSNRYDQLTYDAWKRMFAVNVDGPFLTTWAVKDEMIQRQYGVH